MDIDAVLRDLRTNVILFRHCDEKLDGDDGSLTAGQVDQLTRDRQMSAEGMAAGFEALDDWLSAGGFLPKHWAR